MVVSLRAIDMRRARTGSPTGAIGDHHRSRTRCPTLRGVKQSVGYPPCVSGAIRTTVRPRTRPFRYGSKCVGSSSKSIVRT